MESVPMMRQDQSTQAAERSRSSLAWRRWGVLVVACGLILLSTAQLAYRYTLPTDGWAVLSSDELDRPDWIYLSNLVGAPSGLQRDDRLVAIAGQPVAGQTGTSLAAPAGWMVGQMISLQVSRLDQPIELAIPVVHWTPAAVWRMQLESPEILVGLLGALI